MSIIKYIFYLGVISIAFNWLWSLVAWAVSVIFESFSIKRQDTYNLMSIVGYFLVVSISGIVTVNIIADFGTTNKTIYGVIGAFVVYMNIAGRINRKRVKAMVQMQSKQFKLSKFDGAILILAVLLFVFILYDPAIADNSVTLWFQNAIEWMYGILLLKIILAISAFFFMITMVFNGIGITMNILFGSNNNIRPPFSGGIRMDINEGGNETSTIEDIDYEEVDN